jgi:hydroxymethylpyrimidine/phosphomethylpyrimidine kinase
VAKTRPEARACVLAIGGLDPGGGAGLLADARAIAWAGAFACAATATLTVQSTSGLRAATPVRRAELVAECNEVLRHQRVRAIKVGALGSADNARAVGDLLAIHRDVPAVVDPVMIPTRGRARLLDERALRTLRERVVPRAAIVTANAPEASALTGRRVTRLDEARDAALALLELGARAVLVKGGHLSGRDAVDLLAIAPARRAARAGRADRAGRAGRADRASRARAERGALHQALEPRVIELAAPRLHLQPVHGGGCALASLVAARLAVSADDWAADPDRAVADAVRWAKKEHHAALQRTADVGGELRVLFA